METNETQPEQTLPCNDSSSSGGDCCPSDSGGADGQKSWKSAVFIAVLVLAGAVAAHSLLTKNNQAPGASPCGGGIGSPCATLSADQDKTCPKKAACPLSSQQGSPSSCCPQATPTGCCPLSEQQDKPSPCCPQAAPTGCTPQQDRCPLSEKQDEPSLSSPEIPASGCCPGSSF